MLVRYSIINLLPLPPKAKYGIFSKKDSDFIQEIQPVRFFGQGKMIMKI